jgi:hypothetical protein
VIHRSSWRSVTFLCPQCRLKWTITTASLHKLAGAKARRAITAELNARIIAAYTVVAELTAAAAEYDARRLNKNPLKPRGGS